VGFYFLLPLPRELSLAYYRLYFLDPGSNRIIRFEEYDAADDCDAVRLAERHAEHGPLELWSGRRKVRRFAACVARTEPLCPKGV
jgi:hypothetical protein